MEAWFGISMLINLVHHYNGGLGGGPGLPLWEKKLIIMLLLIYGNIEALVMHGRCAKEGTGASTCNLQLFWGRQKSFKPMAEK